MKVLIIEDDPEITEAVSLCFQLRWPAAEVCSAGEGAEGLMLAGSQSPDIVILDLGLPDMDGMDVLRQIRSFSWVPVIILSIREAEIDRVKGLELGADDYIIKPFGHIELLARVAAVLRRSQMPELKREEKPFVSGNLTIDFTQREVRLDDKLIKLTTTEYNLLYHLVKSVGRVLPQRTLLERVWGPEYIDAADYLKVYISRLREKLEDDPNSPRLIVTERGQGYKFVAPGQSP